MTWGTDKGGPRFGPLATHMGNADEAPDFFFQSRPLLPIVAISISRLGFCLLV